MIVDSLDSSVFDESSWTPVENEARNHKEFQTRAPEQQIRKRRILALAIVFVVLSGFFYWSGTSSGNPVEIGGPQTDFYNQLADGFLHGHLSLPMKVPQSLLDTPNPYSPPCCDLTIWDTSLYHDKFYIEYGPAPVIALYIPWRLLHVGDIPQNLAVILFSIGALAGALMCLWFLVNRYRPRAPLWKVILAGTLLGLGGDLPFLLRNPSIYEASVSAGVFFSMWGLYFLGSGSLGERPTKWRLVLGSMALGFASGSHADLAVLGIVIVAVVAMLWRRGRDASRRDRIRVATSVLGPFVIIGALLASYNYARFGSITQTGESYDVGCNCVHSPQLVLNAIPEGAFSYLVEPPRFTLAFPYFELAPPNLYPGEQLPNNIQEPIGGILALVPITLDLLAIPLLLRRRRSSDTRELGVVAGVLVLAGLAVAFGVTAVGAVNVRFTIRLEADFAGLMMIPAVMIWLSIDGRNWGGKLLSGIGGALAIYGSIVGITISMIGYYNGLYVSNSKTYMNLQAATSAFPTVISKVLGHPVITGVASAPGVTAYVDNFTTLGVGDDLSFFLSPSASEVDVIAPDSGIYALRATFTRGPDAASTGRILIAEQNGAHRFEKRFVPGARAMNLHLSEGLNRLFITARPTTGTASAPGAREVGLSAITVVHT